MIAIGDNFPQNKQRRYAVKNGLYKNNPHNEQVIHNMPVHNKSLVIHVRYAHYPQNNPQAGDLLKM